MVLGKASDKRLTRLKVVLKVVGLKETRLVLLRLYGRDEAGLQKDAKQETRDVCAFMVMVDEDERGRTERAEAGDVSCPRKVTHALPACQTARALCSLSNLPPPPP